MPEQLQLEVVTPVRRVLDEAVDMVTVPGFGGELGILPGHTALISRLQTGVLSYVQGGRTEELLVSGGFVEVNDDRVSVLADLAERPEEIDVAKAKIERERSEKALSSLTGSEEEQERERLNFERAQVRLRLATGVSQRP
jgi:F-type H+-transporting ATPase subunit epsilon